MQTSFRSWHPIQHHGSLVIARPSKNVVHVSRVSLPNAASYNQRSIPVRSDLSVLSIKPTVERFSNIQPSDQTSISTSSLGVRQNVWEYQNYQGTSSISTDDQLNKKKKISILPFQLNPIKDHHRWGKRDKRGGWISSCICVLIVLLIYIAIAITLGIVLSQKPAAKIISSKNAVLRWNSTGITIAGITNIIGANASLLNYPYGLTFDSANTLYIADYWNHRIQKLIPGTSLTETVAGDTNGVQGNTSNRFDRPSDILFDANDNLYVVDRHNDRVQLWMKGATSGITVAGANGTQNISLDNPTSIVFGPDSNTLFISDSINHRIVSYPSGAVVAGGNGPGNISATITQPHGIAYDSLSTSCIISNYGSHNIVRWVVGQNTRTVIVGDEEGHFGSNSTLLKKPVGMKMDPMGNIYVADAGNHRIQLFMTGQSTGMTIAGDGTAGTSAHRLNTPYWVLLDNQLNLYVSDAFNHRVQKYLRY